MSDPASPLTVSAVIPAYRAAGTIGRAVESLLAQTRAPDEILVIDDGSPDDLAAALAPYGDRVRLVRQANGGAASARNRGMDLARGEWIAFLDADDYWEPMKLERQLEVLRRHPEVGLTASRYYQQAPGGARTIVHSDEPTLYDRVLRLAGVRVLAAARKVWTSTVLVRREVLGAHRFDTGLRTAEDVDLWVRLLPARPVYVFSEPLATAVLEPGSLSRSDVAADCRNMLEVLRRHAGLLGRNGLRRWRARTYREWAAGHLGNGEPAAALGPAWKRVCHQPWSPEGWWVLLKSAVQARRAQPSRDHQGVVTTP